MKRFLSLFITFSLCAVFLAACAQEKENKKISKEIRVEQENGTTVVTIIEKSDGKKTKKVLTGTEAEQFVEENEGAGSQVVVVKKMNDPKGGNSYQWVDNEGNVAISMVADDQMIESIEKLKDEVDDLKKDEIKERLEEIIKNREALDEEMVVKAQAIKRGGGISKVNVHEDNGVITIEKTANGSTSVETIQVNRDDISGSEPYVVMASGDDGNEDEELIVSKINGSGYTENMNMDVNVEPDKASLIIDLKLKSDDEALVTVLDPEEKKVYSKQVKGTISQQFKVDISDSKKGTFIVTAKQGNDELKMKLMIE